MENHPEWAPTYTPMAPCQPRGNQAIEDWDAGMVWDYLLTPEWANGANPFFEINQELAVMYKDAASGVPGDTTRHNNLRRQVRMPDPHRGRGG